MNASQAVAVIIGTLVFICLLMPGIARYLAAGILVLLLADYTLAHLTYGSVSLLPFRVL